MLSLDFYIRRCSFLACPSVSLSVAIMKYQLQYANMYIITTKHNQAQLKFTNKGAGINKRSKMLKKRKIKQKVTFKRFIVSVLIYLLYLLYCYLFYFSSLFLALSLLAFDLPLILSICHALAVCL